MRVTVLGSGTSHGVPAIGCDCGVCRSTDPRDRRTRPSILIQLDTAGTTFGESVRSILVDTSTDLRAQALAFDVRRVDAILFTHTHADHVLGLDDVRRYNQMQGTSIPCFGDEETLLSLRRMFAYVFNPPRQLGGGLPQLSPFRLAGPFTLGGVEIVPVRVYHGRLPVLGFRIGSVAAPRRRSNAHPRRASSPPALDALQRLGSRRGRGAHRQRASVLHAHLPRPGARRDVCAAACRRRTGL